MIDSYALHLRDYPSPENVILLVFLKHFKCDVYEHVTYQNPFWLFYDNFKKYIYD